METINISNKKGEGINGPTYSLSKELDYKGTWKIMLKSLNDHSSGIKELIKNSGTAMIRAEKDETSRQCILFIKHKTKGSPSLVGFLDFVGMDKKRFLKLKKINDPKAAHGKKAKEDDVWGGHGNGGKIYAAKMFDKGFWYTCRDNMFNHGGWNSMYVTTDKITENEFAFRYHDNEQHVTNPIKKLESFLKRFGTRFEKLPDDIKILLKKECNFTFFIGENSEKIKVNELKKNILEDSEALEPLGYVNLHIYENGVQLKEKRNDSYVHKPEIIPTHKDFPEPRSFEIPDELTDPNTGEEVSFKNSEKKYLVIRSCELDMTQSRFKDRYIYRGRRSKGIRKFEGFFHPRELTAQYTAFPKHLYGEVYHDELDRFSTITRQSFNTSPFIRSLKIWMGEKIDEIANEFDKTLRDKIEKTAQDEISKFNKSLENLFLDKNYVKNFFKRGFKGKGKGEGEGENEEEEKRSKQVKQIVLKLTYENSGLGVTFRPNITSYNKSGNENQVADNEVSNPSLNWEISDTNIVDEHERHLNLLYTKKPGKVKIKVISKDTRIKITSNTVDLYVTKFSKIKFSENNIDLPQGSKTKLNLNLQDEEGKSVNGSYLMCITNDNSIVSTSSINEIYGLSIGKTTIKCMTNDCESPELKVNVVENKNKKKKKGGGFPKVLISGIDPDPYVEGATDPFILKEKNPPIHQRLQDVEAGVFWINLQSPTASKLHKKGVTKDYKAGEKSKEFKTYMLLKWLEILARVNITNNEVQPDNLPEFYQYVDNQMVDFHEILKPDLDFILSIDFTKRDEE